MQIIWLENSVTYPLKITLKVYIVKWLPILLYFFLAIPSCIPSSSIRMKFLLNKKNANISIYKIATSNLFRYITRTMRFCFTINPRQLPIRIIQSWRLFLGESHRFPAPFELVSLVTRVFDERELIVWSLLPPLSPSFTHGKTFNDLAPLKNIFLAIESFLSFFFFFFSHIF